MRYQWCSQDFLPCIEAFSFTLVTCFFSTMYFFVVVVDNVSVMLLFWLSCYLYKVKYENHHEEKSKQISKWINHWINNSIYQFSARYRSIETVSAVCCSTGMTPTWHQGRQVERSYFTMWYLVNLAPLWLHPMDR